MTASGIRRVVASLAVVALLAGTTPATRRTTPRCHCAAGCPMHVLHHTCHGGVGLQGTCGHGAPAAASAAGVRIALAAHALPLPAFTRRSVAPAGAPVHAGPAVAPPTEPPRASLA